MARPTKSKVLYVQMKGRGTRKCKETGKDIYKLVDFVDISHLEPIVTNDTPGVAEEPVEQEEEEVARQEREGTVQQEGQRREVEGGSQQDMVIADVPVHLVFSQTISPELLEELRRQVEAQLRGGMEREGIKQRFAQTILCWRYFKQKAIPDHSFLATLGFDLSTLRDLYGEPEATLEDFVAVATGESDFDALRLRRQFETWAFDRGLSKEQRDMVLAICDFKSANPDITPSQILRSHWLDQAGGAPRIKVLFGDLTRLITLADEALRVSAEASISQEAANGANP